MLSLLGWELGPEFGDKRSGLCGSELLQLWAVVGDDELDEEEESLGLLVELILEDAGRSLDISLLRV